MEHAKPPKDIEVLLRELNQDFMGWDDPPARLSRALDRDELVLYAQPILALCGEPSFPMAEVLVRLQEDEAVFLPPGGFLPLFGYFGLLPRLDRWVARQSLARLARAPRVPRLCINISTPTLSDPAFVTDLVAMLEHAKVSPGSLVVEIDEHDAIERPDLVKACFEALRAAGCKSAIEGFGRRSVSLSVLTSMRPDYVKIDGGVVRSINPGLSSRKKLGAIVSVAKAAGFELIAAGVETGETLAQLREAGVDYAQGYGIQVPGPIGLVIEH